MRWIDIPPVWLALHVGAVWMGSPYLPFRVSSPRLAQAGSASILLGVVLMVLALGSMRRAKTTPIPHREASRLVSSGVFSLSRNPIYVGDVLILIGAVLRSQAPILLPLVPLFAWIITRRFIQPEEARLRSAFGADFEEYCARTRRWI